jgi:heparin/heparan-sulfate lyase
LIKGEFQRQGGMAGDPIPILLLNDPALTPEPSLAALPLTIDFGPVLGSMVARTGWNLGPNLADVVVEMKGGGYNFGNHQHSDAGSFQIYYRGLQAADLGQYHFYGTPYDMGFCKRSVAHCMLLAVDPDEKFSGTAANDGGTRFVRVCPTTPPQRPFFSYFVVDLKSAYSGKIREYVRTFCFLNLDNPRTPAVLIVLDNVTTARPEFKKYWQINTLNPPERTADGVLLRNSALGLSGTVSVRMLRPQADQRVVEILSGAAVHNVFGQQFTSPFPTQAEANGHRVMFSPKTSQADDIFLTVMPMSDDKASELPVALAETPATFALALADRVVVLSKTSRRIAQPFTVDVPPGGSRQLLLAGLAPGYWSIRDRDNRLQFNAQVEAGKNTAFFVVPGGRFTVQPEAIPGAPEYRSSPDYMPALSAPAEAPHAPARKSS